jgi:hypothetical protein
LRSGLLEHAGYAGSGRTAATVAVRIEVLPPVGGIIEMLQILFDPARGGIRLLAIR